MGTAVPLAVTVTTTVVKTNTVETLCALVVVAGAGVTRVEEVRNAVPVPVDSTGEVEGLEVTLPVEVPKPKAVAGVEITEELVKTLVELIDVAEEPATLVGKPVLTRVDKVVTIVVGLPKPKVGAYEEPN